MAVHHRTGLTIRPLAPPFDRLWIVRGTLVPVRATPRVGASSRNYRFSAKVQVSEDAGARLAITATRWVSGGTADGKARRDSRLAPLRAGVTALGDRAGINTGLVA
ncbi:hypothetical protein [Streptomyces sp. E5N91]|uniref:hypothetical protein n=1 Tax=Streptomyces sp. E5N91 TaxID=1851996 RepID=UPI00187D67FB|nr:hypothetical protein [Streptomyces sp. E5N91]